VVVWDNGLCKLLGPDTRTKDSDGEDVDEEEEDDESDDEDTGDDVDTEPQTPAGSPAVLDSINFEYDPRDPVALQLGELAMHDATRYHLVKSASVKADRLEQWKQSLHDTVVELSSAISTHSLTNTRSKKAAKKIQQELHHYVCLPYDLSGFYLLISNTPEAMRVYGLYGISVSGIVLGANMVAPSTVLHPSFFGPEPKFVDVLQNMLWRPQDVQQYLVSTAL